MTTIREAYAKLKEIRKRTDLELPPNKYLRTELVQSDGSTRPFKLRYYQAQGVCHILQMKQFVLGDDTGLGKTAMTIAAYSYLWTWDPTLPLIVVCPKSVILQWADEFDKFTTGVKVFCMPSKPTKKKRAKTYEAFDAAEGPKVLVMNYASIRTTDFTDYLQERTGYGIVFDECTAFKNPKTTTFNRCHHLARNAERVLGLTATLIYNNLEDGFGIYNVVVPDLFGTKTSFYEDYCIVQLQRVKGGRRIPKVTGHTKRHITKFRRKIDPWFLGRVKQDVAKELPTITTRRLPIEMTPSLRNLYNEVMEGAFVKVPELPPGVMEDEADEGSKEPSKLAVMIQLQQTVNHPMLLANNNEDINPRMLERAGALKHDTLLDLLKEGGEFHGFKTIVFSRFRSMIDILEDSLQKTFKGREDYVVRITGAEDGDGRHRSQQLFQDPTSDTKVILINTAAETGVNLQAAQVFVFYDTPWSPGMLIQAIGRMVRIGSEHNRVYVVHLVVKDTIDDYTVKAVSKKMRYFEQALGKRFKTSEEGAFSLRKMEDEIFDMIRRDAERLKGKK